MIHMNAASMNTQSTLAAAAADPPPPPPTHGLLIDLAEPILALAIHRAAVSSPWQPAAIAKPLNVLPRTHVPLVTKIALLHMPHVDMNLATKFGDMYLLKLMLKWSWQPHGRPLRWSEVLLHALNCDSPIVLEWWLDDSRLVLDWDWSCHDLMAAFCTPANLMWFDWWKARGFPYLELEDGESTFALMAVHGSQIGRVDILDWLLENAGAHRMVSGKSEFGSAIVGAAQSGHVHVLEWWFAKSKAGVMAAKMDWIEVFSVAFSTGQVAVLEWCETQPLLMEAWRQQPLDWEGVFSAAFSSGHVTVLEWCKSQSSVMQAWRQGLEKCARASDGSSKISSMCHDLGKNGLGPEWWHAFDLLPFAAGNSYVSREACAKGQVDLVKELHSHGYLQGSSKQLIQVALTAGKLELLEWIQANVDPSIPDRSDWYLGHNSFHTACATGNVDILEWLFKKGWASPYLTMEDWTTSFESASNEGHTDVLDWLADHVPRIVSAAPTSPTWTPIIMIWRVFCDGRVDVVEWWVHKSGSLKNVYDLTAGQPYLQACDSCHAHEAPSQLAALKAWLDGGQLVDFAECIHAASVQGRIDVLDWLLHSTSASEEDFTNAWSSAEFSDEREAAGNIHAEYSFDLDNHGKSLTWWRANLPHVAAHRVNRGPYDNPIHAHYLQHVLKNTSFDIVEPFQAIEEYGGGVDLLEYRKQMGDADELEEDAEWYLEEASERGQCSVLEWFKTESGFAIACPKGIVDGNTQVARRAKAWWAKSGLVDGHQLAGIKAG